MRGGARLALIVGIVVGGARCAGHALPSEPAAGPANAGGMPDEASTGLVPSDASALPAVAQQWAELAPPASLGLSGLQVTAASAAATDDLFFAAIPAGAGAMNAAVVRWRQGVWTSELAVPGNAWSAARVSAASSDDVWSVLGGALYHRDGAGWTRDDSWQAAIPAGTAATGPWTAVAIRAVARGDAWLVASGDPAGMLLHRRDGGWTAIDVEPSPSSPAVYDFSDLWVSCTGDVWLGGTVGDPEGPTQSPALLFGFDGTSWVHYGVGLWDVMALWDDSAAGLWMAIPEGDGLLTVAHFDSSRGQSVFMSIDGWPADGSEIHSLWGRAADDIWGAGDDVAHWDGKSWRRADVPDGARPPVHQGSGKTIVTGDSGSVWLVSGGPRFFRLGAAP